MQAEMLQAAEESFIERYLEFGDDDETKDSNRKVLCDLVQEYRAKSQELAQDIEDGIAVNESEAILTVQILSFAKKYLEKF